MKILVCTDFDIAQKEQLKKGLGLSNELFFKSDLTEEALKDVIANTSIILGNLSLAYWSLPKPKLQFWQLDSAGFDQYKGLDVEIPVANMGDFFAQNCAETMIAGVMAFYRGIPRLVRLQIEKEWIGSKIRPNLQNLSGKNVIILGAGTIALAVKQMLSGFGCKITLTARNNPIATIHHFSDLLKALPSMDVVINTLPGSAHQYVNRSFIAAMKQGSIYASVGRGDTTDENALLEALIEGKIAGAVLDVTETEPLLKESKLWQMEQVILTQHSGGGNHDEDFGKAEHFIENVKRFLKGEQPKNLIDLKRGY
jgi:glyoxylate/hydroxypyruvate reductase A